MKKFFILTFILFFTLTSGNVFSSVTNLLNADLLTVKTQLEKLYYKASSTGSLSKKEINMLSHIRTNIDSQKKENNTNIIPVYYMLGNTYKALNKKDDAIYCYRTIVKHYPYTPMGKKAMVNLKYYGETYSSDTGKTIMIKRPEDDEN